MKTNPEVVGLIEGFFVFEPDGYSLAYHTSDQYPANDKPFLKIEFKGEDCRGAWFDFLPGPYPTTTAINTTLDRCVQLAHELGVDGFDVARRLTSLFVSGLHHTE